ncbi:MAG: hypothetical protein J6T89_03545 [Bacteroidales bacterium]|nr:hypothetical protein [Bacteroidales bacterium]
METNRTAIYLAPQSDLIELDADTALCAVSTAEKYGNKKQYLNDEEDWQWNS